MSDQHGKVLRFGPLELSIGNRLLTNGAKIVPLGARAMDLLIVLVEQANKVVGRRTLIERAWPKRGAEQVSLRVTTSEGPRSDWAHRRLISFWLPTCSSRTPMPA
jgi:DNA-binding winged helix-turn-helix (wHTH) protein